MRQVILCCAQILESGFPVIGALVLTLESAAPGTLPFSFDGFDESSNEMSSPTTGSPKRFGALFRVSN